MLSYKKRWRKHQIVFPKEAIPECTEGGECSVGEGMSSSIGRDWYEGPGLSLCKNLNHSFVKSQCLFYSLFMLFYLIFSM